MQTLKPLFFKKHFMIRGQLIFHLSYLFVLTSCDKNKNESFPASPSVKPTYEEPSSSGTKSLPKPPIAAQQKSNPTSPLEKGLGSDRVMELQIRLKGITPDALKGFLNSQLGNLFEEDLGPLSQVEEKIQLFAPGLLTKYINDSPTQSFKRFFADILQGNAIGIEPGTVLQIASGISDPEIQKNLVSNTMKMSMQSKPLDVIPYMSEIFKIVSSGLDSVKDEKAFFTAGSKALTEFGQAIPTTQRDEVWNAVTNMSDEGIKLQLAAGIFDGQLSRDATSASKWLDTLPPGPEKSVAIRILVSDLYRNGDSESASAWLKSAESYLRTTDRANIDIVRAEYNAKYNQ